MRAAWPAVWMLAGCGSDEPCFGLRQGEVLNVDVVAEYTATSPYDFELGRPGRAQACRSEFDLATGAQLQVQVFEQVQSDEACRRNTVRVNEGSGLELGEAARELSFGVSPVAEIAHGSQRATVDGCTGRWGIALNNRSQSNGADGDPFVPAPSNGYPPIIMHLAFQADDKDTPACAQLLEGEWDCTDYYVVELHRP